MKDLEEAQEHIGKPVVNTAVFHRKDNAHRILETTPTGVVWTLEEVVGTTDITVSRLLPNGQKYTVTHNMGLFIPATGRHEIPRPSRQ